MSAFRNTFNQLQSEGLLRDGGYIDDATIAEAYPDEFVLGIDYAKQGFSLTTFPETTEAPKEILPRIAMYTGMAAVLQQENEL